MTGDIYADFTCNRCGESSDPIKLIFWHSLDGSIEIRNELIAGLLEAEGWETRKDNRPAVPYWAKIIHICDRCVAREKKRNEILGEAT